MSNITYIGEDKYTVTVSGDEITVVTVGTQGATGAQGPQGPQGDPGAPGTTDHLLLTNIGTNTHAQIDTHIADTSNPHSTTATHVGLGNVDNTADADKPISTATQTALDGKADLSGSPGQIPIAQVPVSSIDHADIQNVGTNTHAQIDTHIANTSNPHGVDATDVGLGNVDNTADADKPVSTAQQTALDGKSDTGHSHTLSDVTDSGTMAAINDATSDGTTYGRKDGAWAAVQADTDEKSKVSANDTTAGYLNGKLIAGVGIDLTENNDGGNETLSITNTGIADALAFAIAFS